MDKRKLGFLIVLVALLAVLLASAPGPVVAETPAGHLDPGTQFFVPRASAQARAHINWLYNSGRRADARLLRVMTNTPQAVWLTDPRPARVQEEVRRTVRQANGQGKVPVLVAYNIPFRDCAQFSAGGATTVSQYKTWIDNFAAGIGNLKAIVILEPDGLGIIPWYKQFRGLPGEAGSYEWCQPADADEATAANDRFAMLNYAVDALKARPNTSVYLDGTHSAWLGAGDTAHRLVQAGVLRADGFFLNVSNYVQTERLQKYGAWVSKCIWFATDPASWGNGHFDWCASQYYPADPNDFSTWHLTDQWYIDNVESQTWAYPGEEGLSGFVIDTSRNGQGPWTPAASYPDPQVWCNPPGRGVGLRPTADTGNPMLDAYLWIKIPGESDGECTRGLGPAGQTVDPEWGVIDPAAGHWFRPMALQLARNANPPLLP
ncbi:MAG TPA: glycoside hydrolase family 6 protein [Promineifilum sp.]|nr:glycoside hydrolase family 6 protein [Promineifilum sp.]